MLGNKSEVSFELRIKKNNNYYDQFFDKVKGRTENREYKFLLDRFLKLLPQNTSILDIGCGTGEHLVFFKDKSYSAYGIEPSSRMRSFCIDLGLSVFDGCFENIRETITSIEQQIGGIWCAASLLHVPQEHFETTIQNIYHILPTSGVFFFTVRLGVGSSWDSYDNINLEAERFIQLYDEPYLESVLNHFGFILKLKLIEESYWGRKTDWISYILVKP